MILSTGVVIMILSVIGIIGFSIWLFILYSTEKKKKAEIYEEIHKEYLKTSQASQPYQQRPF